VATFVLVHGGGHGGWCYQRVAPLLRAAGHDVYTPTLTGLGDRAHLLRADIDLDFHIGDIVKVLHFDAATPENGESLVDHAGPVINAVRPYGEVVDGIELVLLPGPHAGRLYGVEDPDDLAWMAERLTGHPWQCFEQKLVLGNEDAVRAIPDFHVVCTSTIPTRDRALMERARTTGRLWDIDTGHDLMITEPKAVADALLEIANA
jgi:pimeloyl-ACP methyl ester carboxylesterase